MCLYVELQGVCEGENEEEQVAEETVEEHGRDWSLSLEAALGL